MENTKEKLNEVEAAISQIEKESELIKMAIDASGKEIEEEYAVKIVRSEIDEMADVLNAISEIVGKGEAVSVNVTQEPDGFNINWSSDQE